MTSQVSFNQQALLISGDLTFATVQSVHCAVKELAQAFNSDIVVDFSAAAKVDTASLALCLSIQRMMADGCVVTYKNVPQEMILIAESVGVAALFT
ncbi:MAG: STAS domain-containing protein [Pseudomonadales bacterium]|nr:STAS domain-containing protein [Pseudomonadales bacterium]NRA18662.1 STAS domain-containing protein [Oceanospirillaceae bacterium]